MPLDLEDTDTAALVELLREVIAADRYPRIQKLRTILNKLEPLARYKLEPPARWPEPFPAPKPPGYRLLLYKRKVRLGGQLRFSRGA